MDTFVVRQVYASFNRHALGVYLITSSSDNTIITDFGIIAIGKMYELPNSIYNSIEKEFINCLGEQIAKKILAKHLESTLVSLTTQSFVNIMNCFTII